jgi:hypothetical protein
VLVSIFFYITLWKYLHAPRARPEQQPKFKNVSFFAAIMIFFLNGTQEMIQRRKLYALDG